MLTVPYVSVAPRLQPYTRPSTAHTQHSYNASSVCSAPFVSVALKLRTHTHPYGHYPKLRSRPKHLEKHIALAVSIALALLVAIVVPLAAILPQKYVDRLPLSILVPLYIYPSPGEWDRLYHAIIRHPDLNFTVIVNPSYGPGNTPVPGPLYIEALKKLSAFTNVQTVGYIDTKGGARANGTVNHEITTYSGWAQNPEISLSGVFFDCKPTQGSLQEVQYLQNISGTVKHAANFTAPRTVIHGPGVLPNATLNIADVDITVVFEGAFANVPSHEVLRRQLERLPKSGRRNYAVFVHSLPRDLGRIRLRRLINGLKKDVQYVFVTDRKEKVYEGFGGVWEEFLDLTF